MYNHLTLTDLIKFWTVLTSVFVVSTGWQVYDKIHSRILVEAKSELSSEEKLLNDLNEQYAAAKLLSIVTTAEKIKYTEGDLFCLAKNIYHEAGFESRLGKFAIAQVTINRSKDPAFSSKLCSVVLAKNQFSWANDDKLRWSHPTGRAWSEATRIAKEVLENGKRIKGMEKVLYFHSASVDPHWKHLSRYTQIGANVFYTRYSSRPR